MSYWQRLREGRNSRRLNAAMARLQGQDFRTRKKLRTEFFEKFVKGWKERACTACAGSGYYDHNGSPPCGACDGTGKERYKP